MEYLHLINDAELILHHIKVGDIFGVGTNEEYLDDATLKIANRWIVELHDLGVQSDNPLAKELCETWYINGNRVNSTRIKRAIEILKQL